MSRKEEIITQSDFEKLVQKQMEISKKELMKAFEKINKNEDYNRKTKTNSNRRKHSR